MPNMLKFKLVHRYQMRIRSLGSKTAKTGSIGLLLTSSILAIFVSASPAVSADTLNYPWYNAPCEFDPNGGSSCTNPTVCSLCTSPTCKSGPNSCNDFYNWYENGGNGFTGTDCWYGTNSECFDSTGYEYRNCTSYTAWRLMQVGVASSKVKGLGNGGQWYNNAPSTEQSTTPKAWDAAVVPGQVGHVAFVESVSSDGSQITVSEYNEDTQGNGDTRTGTPSSMGFTEYVDFGVHPATSPGLGGGDGSSRATNNLDAWIEQSSPTNGSNLGHLVWTGTTWNPWETIPVSTEQMTTQPAAVSWSSSRIDVFARGPAGDLIHTWTDNPNDLSSWNPWESLGGCIIGSPTVTSYGVGRLDVFAEGCNTTGGNLWHTWYDTSVDPNHWQPWENIATSLVMTAPPSAVSWASGRIDVFARGTDASLMHTFYDGAWESVLSLGGCIVGSPAASSWAAGRVDAWVEGCNTTGGNFYQTWWSGPTGWSAFNLVSPTYQISGVLGAVSWGSNRIDMFTRASDNSLDHWWFDGNSFQGPENKGGTIAP